MVLELRLVISFGIALDLFLSMELPLENCPENIRSRIQCTPRETGIAVSTYELTLDIALRFHP